MGLHCFMGTEFQLGMMKNSGEDGADYCTALSTHSMPLNRTI